MICGTAHTCILTGIVLCLLCGQQFYILQV
jgi:hypothetical protein